MCKLHTCCWIKKLSQVAGNTNIWLFFERRHCWNEREPGSMRNPKKDTLLNDNCWENNIIEAIFILTYDTNPWGKLGHFCHIFFIIKSYFCTCVFNGFIWKLAKCCLASSYRAKLFVKRQTPIGHMRVNQFIRTCINDATNRICMGTHMLGIQYVNPCFEQNESTRKMYTCVHKVGLHVFINIFETNRTPSFGGS